MSWPKKPEVEQRINVIVNSKLKIKAQMKALKERTTLTEVVNKFLEEWVKSN